MPPRTYHGSGSDAARAAHPRTIATIRGHVVAFAQNEGYLAWLSEGRCGEAFALAVTGEMTAALVRAGSSWRIEISGNRARSVALRHGRPPRLVASGHTVVFRVRRTIYALETRSGEPRVVARSSGTPIGLSMVGRRVAWAENLRHGARVRAVVLPRSS